MADWDFSALYPIVNLLGGLFIAKGLRFILNLAISINITVNGLITSPKRMASCAVGSRALN